jgi:cysteine desulfurase/selenocysteine lyase
MPSNFPDIASVLEDFPLLQSRPDLVYFDSAATAQKPRSVLAALNSYYTEFASNVHRGGYSLAAAATNAYEDARSAVATFLGANDSEIVFTRGTTEALNLLAATICSDEAFPGSGVVVSTLEHHANFVTWQQHAKRTGQKFHVCPINSVGLFDLGALDALLTKRPKAVALSGCSNVLGTFPQLEQALTMIRKAGAVSVVDAAQLVVHRPVDVKKLDCDFLVFSGHKLYGPTGVGVLYGKSEVLSRLAPWQFGGEMVDRVSSEASSFKPAPWRFEAGTPPIAEAIGLGAAVKYAGQLGWDRVIAHEKAMTAAVLEALTAYPEVMLYGLSTTEGRAGIVSFNLRGVHPHDVATVFDSCGVAVRAGSHCAQPLLQHLGIQASVRISVGPYNTVAQVAKVSEAIQRCLSFFGAGRGSRSGPDLH